MFSIEIFDVSDDRSRMVLSGDFAAGSYLDLESVLVEEVAKGRRFIVVDMGKVNVLSSCVFGAFLQTMALLQPMGGNMSFVNADRMAHRVFKMLGMECCA